MRRVEMLMGWGRFDMDTPFALRGLLGSCLNDQHRLQQLPVLTLPPMEMEDKPAQRSPVGSRAFHGSRMAYESAKGAYSNRPLSPHLPLKKPQLSASYSISHRILGAAVASSILLFPLVLKFSTFTDV
ncbi:hypothetical protein HPP92_012015 [Vanilla planifolia]|uniref:Succinate dehydrogenase subunit 3 n=2 Tax=Vanilla planifolia TaxID=51239 RepID=A0A835R752_VANPL|nr:hypothetical protein HPP92_012015 [Vanilla planifolia]